MKLDVGFPGEKAFLANGKEAETRDVLGLSLDTQHYAKKDCGNCFGRGVETVINPISDERAKQLIEQNPTNESFLFQTAPGKWHEKLARMCMCAKRRYRKAYAQFGELLVKEKLAKASGIRIENDGAQVTIYELL